MKIPAALEFTDSLIALDRIASILNIESWSPDTLDEIARVMTDLGYEFDEFDELEELEPEDESDGCA